MEKCIKKEIKLTKYHTIDICMQFNKCKDWESMENKVMFIFSASGWYKNGRDEYGGQCFDDFIKDDYLLKSDIYDLFLKVYKYWKKYHLNNLKAGNKEQEEYLNSIHFNINADNFDNIGKELDKKGLQKKYKYGSSWLCEEIPEKDVRNILMELFGLSIFDVLNLKKCVREKFTSKY